MFPQKKSVYIRIDLFFLIILHLFNLFSCTKNPDIDYHNWTMYSGDPSGSKYSALDDINKENVNNLKIA